MPTAPTLELPAFPPVHDTEPAVLDASRAVVALYLTEGTDRSIKALAEHTGLSERTFYRYFPHKEDVVRPYLQAAMHALVRQLRHPSGVPLRDEIAGHHGAILDLAKSFQVRRLLEVMGSSARLQAVWLQVLTDAERAFAEVLAARLEQPAGSTRVRFAAAALVAAGRMALEAEDRPPSEVFSACLDLLDPRLFDEERR